jgi:hypothetical protein
MKQLAMQAIAAIPVLFLHGIACYIALFIYLAVSMNVVTNTAKTRAIEDRVGNLEAMTYPNTGGTINGSVAATGNVQVNGYVYGSGGGTLENNSNIHTSGVLQADSGVTTSGVNSSGQVIAGGAGGSAALEVGGSGHLTANLQVDGTATASSGLNVSGGIENDSMHASANVQIDGAATVNGGLTSGGGIATASMHSTGNVQIDGNLNGGPVVVGGQAGVSTVGSAGGSYSATYEDTLASAINGIISRLNSSGLI